MNEGARLKRQKKVCENCGDSGIELVYGGHGNILELACDVCTPADEAKENRKKDRLPWYIDNPNVVESVAGRMRTAWKDYVAHRKEAGHPVERTDSDDVRAALSLLGNGDVIALMNAAVRFAEAKGKEGQCEDEDALNEARENLEEAAESFAEGVGCV